MEVTGDVPVQPTQNWFAFSHCEGIGGNSQGGGKGASRHQLTTATMAYTCEQGSLINAKPDLTAAAAAFPRENWNSHCFNLTDLFVDLNRRGSGRSAPMLQVTNRQSDYSLIE